VWLTASSGAIGMGCSPDETRDTPTFGGRGRVATTRGSAVALSYEEGVAVVANRTDGVVSVLHLSTGSDPEKLVKKKFEIPFHPLDRSKPWAAVIGADDDTAYVVLRGTGEVVRISHLHEVPTVTGRVNVGSEPTAIAISPSGARLFVANWGEGTISVVLANELIEAKWDLNLRLARSGRLGPLAGPADSAAWSEEQLLRQRPAIAHPRALAMTDRGGDDNDEILYATEFFAQPTDAADAANPDISRQGIVYPIVVGVGGGNAPPDPETGQPLDMIPLQPIATGFDDAQPAPTSCFPNQLHAVATAGDRLVVTSVCASPSGPVEPGPKDATGSDAPTAANNFKTLVHASLSQVDTTQDHELGNGVALTRLFSQTYGADDTELRMPLIPNDIAVGPPIDADGQRWAYVTALGSSAVFPLLLSNGGEVGVVDEPGSRFIDLGPTSMPVGITLFRTRPWALVANDRKPDVALLDLQDLRRLKSYPTVETDWSMSNGSSGTDVISDEAKEGRRLFATGLAVWSAGGQAWSSCESCHPDGLSDGVTWRFARGPRRTISTAGTYFGDAPTRRLLLWTANADEVHDVEAIARNLSGGVGGVLWDPYAETPSKNCRLVYDGKQPVGSGATDSCAAPKPTTNNLTGLNGSLSAISPVHVGDECDDRAVVCDINASSDWDDIDAFIRTVRAPRAPRPCLRAGDLACLDPARVKAGKTLFEDAGCASCHSGSGWTISRVFYTPGTEANGGVPSVAPTVPLDRAALLGRLRTLTYTAPDDRFQTLNPPLASGTAHFRPAPPDDASDDDLLAYLYPPRGTSAPLDQINCVLRSVGTFPDQTKGENRTGVVAPGAPGFSEERLIVQTPAATDQAERYVTKLAIGETGFNIPSLLGLATAGFYFHGGNARTLEEVLSDTFASHHAAIVPEFRPSAEQVRALVSYLLSIDDDTEVVPTPSPQNGELPFDPDLCAQFEQLN
jgi:hypothetical protein